MDRQTDRQTDIVVYREVTLPKNGFNKKKYSGHAMLNTFYILSEKSRYFLVGGGSYFMFDVEITSL